MARIPNKKKYPWYMRFIFLCTNQGKSKTMEPLLLWGRSPRLFFSFFLFFSALYRKSSPLSKELRSLIGVKVSQDRNCSFCTNFNQSAYEKRGCSKEKLEALKSFKNSPIFSEAEKAALEYCEGVLTNVKDDNFQDLKKFFTSDQIVELTALITMHNLSSQFNNALF